MVKKKETPKAKAKKAKVDETKGYKTEMEVHKEMEEEAERIRLERLK